ncbi:MAG: alpha/beta fold hydrolase [Gemmatimonadota bacterium]
MPLVEVGNTRLHYERTGSGEPLVLVHGSWVDRRSWSTLVPFLEPSFEVVIYDRRGHGRSEGDPGSGSALEDAEDLAALIESLGMAPANVLGNSFGGSITLVLAARRPELLRSLSVHEPPLFGLLAGEPGMGAEMDAVGEHLATVVGTIESGDHEQAARLFVEEVALGPGSWENVLTPEIRSSMVENAPTFPDEIRDQESFGMDPATLRDFPHPALLTRGNQSPDFRVRPLDVIGRALPGWRQATIPGAGHVPQLSHPEVYARLITEFFRSA